MNSDKIKKKKKLLTDKVFKSLNYSWVYLSII